MLHSRFVVTSGINAAVLAWRNAVGAVSPQYLQALSDFVAAEQTSGAWWSTDDYWLLWGETAAQALTSLKQRRVATAVNSPTFTPLRGYTFDGATNYIDTGFVPSTMAVAMIATNMRLAVYERAALAAATTYAAGTFDTGTRGLAIRTRSTGDVMQGILNCTASTMGTGILSSLGYAAVSRTSEPVFAGWKNGVAAGNGAPGTVSSVIPTRSVYIGGYNNAGALGSPRATSIGLVCAGASLTAAQELAQYNAVQAFATAIGAQV